MAHLELLSIQFVCFLRLLELECFYRTNIDSKKDILFTAQIKELFDAGKRNLVYPALKSRISFDIKDEDWDKSIPDYIYALKKFTRGDDCSIIVRKIQDDED